MNSIVTLNVGGVLYTTTKNTLLKQESFFSGLFSGNFSTTLDDKNNIFIDRNGELFKYVLEFLRNNTLPKRILIDKALLEDLLQEAEFYCIEDLVFEIKSKLNSEQINQDTKKIRTWELEVYLKKGYHVIGTGIEPIRYHKCPRGHDPRPKQADEYFNYYDSRCRHSFVEFIEEYVPFIVVSTSVPVGPIFDSSVGMKAGENRVINEY
ncbi:BTB/POZ protein [Glomus cerebriforme]|uniref:BTB/POZ protein n=1 Tax=Glomus cerebriforme TaxID=658196 RepID=A0A397T774_9GLOM|nr:BTB/POZ protein [Glomus cerebriforme]